MHTLARVQALKKLLGKVNAARSGQQLNAETLALMKIVEKHKMSEADIKALIDWRVDTQPSPPGLPFAVRNSQLAARSNINNLLHYWFVAIPQLLRRLCVSLLAGEQRPRRCVGIILWR